MMFRSIILLSLAALMVSAWTKPEPEEVLIPHTPKPDCKSAQCPSLPGYMRCSKMETPKGQCCPVCSCTDDQDRTHAANEFFQTKIGSHCWGCTCFVDDKGIKQAACYQRYCPPANCPPIFRELTTDGCCFTCPARRRPTFPPRGRGGFPARGNGGFPPRG